MSVLKEQIRFREALFLAEAKSGFSLQEFKQLQTLEEQTAYAEKRNLVVFRGGSSRITYMINNRHVIKLARLDAQDKGRLQNATEVKVAQNPIAEQVVTRVFDYDSRDNNWLIAEVVRGIRTVSEFEKLTGVSWNAFRGAVTALQGGPLALVQAEVLDELEDLKKLSKTDTSRAVGNRLLRKQELLKSLEHPMVAAVDAVISIAKLMPGDILSVEHWGKTADGRLALMDYGFSEEGWKKHYGGK